VWMMDITFIPTRRGWLYVATTVDLFSRRVVGMAHEPPHRSATRRGYPAHMAIKQRRPSRGLIIHSGQGQQYAGSAYRGMLHRHAIVQSMSRKRNYLDNAVAESFFQQSEKRASASCCV
ncbi:MAG: DDE-type integrase/transposase/recombinase, partial [Gammaproteobacteria bacterium]